MCSAVQCLSWCGNSSGLPNGSGARLPLHHVSSALRTFLFRVGLVVFSFFMFDCLDQLNVKTE